MSKRWHSDIRIVNPIMEAKTDTISNGNQVLIVYTRTQREIL